MCFMIVGLKENVKFVVKAIPETEVNGDWLKDEIEELLRLNLIFLSEKMQLVF